MLESKKAKKWLDELREKHPTLYFLGDLFLNIVVIVFLVYTVRTYLISPFQVFGPSMCNTLNEIHDKCQDSFGEYLIVNKAIYYPFFGDRRYRTPERGDIIVFRPPHNAQDFYIKRIIALPGEKVKLQNGKVYIYNKEHQSGWELPEEYLSKENKNQTFPMNAQRVMTFEVPEGRYFVMGDNRRKSTDSRTCFRGPGDRECNDDINHFLPIERIEGKASVVLWPFNKIRILSNPAYSG
ncbi:signal peptidase I [Candidatus Peregrinibacteria bacterium]|nr:signal peptidase I [Candidatus Peregrinibacteria bacterium]